ncbi:MAG TPA: type IV toxin-antitoxin system AbiEi family antitoxin domain-containing protein [Actinomycetota bacterium]|nr:type IV toxin-antitoxin system AbiEi family antitoxin domain-containing protein [Actinomycetota bacterium]
MVPPQPFRNKEAVRAALARQMGLITKEQAIAGGETDASIRHAIRSGEWAPMYAGIYRSTAFPGSFEQECLAATLRAPGRTWVSHGAAAALHGLRDRTTEIDVTSASAIRARGDISVHRVSGMAACDRAEIGPIPVTAIERTLVDLAGTLTIDELDRCIDEAVMTRKTSLLKIDWRLRRLGGRGRAGTATLRRLLDGRLTTGEIDSPLERRFLTLLKEARVPKPALQFPIELPKGTVYADFAYPARRLIIEVQGYRWHGGRERWESDQYRSSELAALGWRVMFVTRRQIEHERRQTIDRIRRALGFDPLF